MSKNKICPLMSKAISGANPRGYNYSCLKEVKCEKENCQWWSYAIDNCIVHMMENLTSVVGNIALKD